MPKTKVKYDQNSLFQSATFSFILRGAPDVQTPKGVFFSPTMLYITYAKHSNGEKWWADKGHITGPQLEIGNRSYVVPEYTCELRIAKNGDFAPSCPDWAMEIVQDNFPGKEKKDGSREDQG